MTAVTEMNFAPCCEHLVARKVIGDAGRVTESIRDIRYAVSIYFNGDIFSTVYRLDWYLDGVVGVVCYSEVS